MKTITTTKKFSLSTLVRLAMVTLVTCSVGAASLAEAHASDKSGTASQPSAANTTKQSRSKLNRDFTGQWQGAFVLKSTTCGGNFPSSFGFGHAIAQFSNAVRLDTSHDGTLFGTSRKGGTQLQLSKRVLARNGWVDIKVTYGNNNGYTSAVNLDYIASNGYASCKLSYTATAIRAF